MNNQDRYSYKVRLCADELKSLIDGPKFLQAAITPRKGEILVSNATDAEIFACDQDVDLIKGSEYKYWTNILENNSRIVEQMDVQNALGLGEDFSDFISDVFDKEVMPALISKCEEFDISNSIADVICGDFYIFLLNRTFFLEQLPLSEKMYDIYFAGGIPCGWKGEFPEGEILIYSKVQE